MDNKKEYNLADFKNQQQEVDMDRANLRKSMIPDEKEKHDVVEKVINMLSNAGIRAYMYADLPNPDYPIGIPAIYQFNTIGGTIFNNDGSINESKSVDIAFFMEAMWKANFELVTLYSSIAIKNGLDKIDSSTPEGFNTKMTFFMNYIAGCMYNYQKRVNDILDDEG